jgi:hypothetical protein
MFLTFLQQNSMVKRVQDAFQTITLSLQQNNLCSLQTSQNNYAQDFSNLFGKIYF